MIEVWGRRSSSNVQKVVWALDELGLPFNRHTVGGSFGGNRAPAYLAMNPNGLVPVLQDGDITMFESNAIVRYLAARYGEGALRPKDPKALAMAETSAGSSPRRWRARSKSWMVMSRSRPPATFM